MQIVAHSSPSQSARSCSDQLRFKPIRITWWDALLDPGEPNLAEFGKLDLLA
jgi:hypothetical protein